MTEWTPSRGRAVPFSAGSQSVSEFLAQTIDPTTRHSRQQTRGNSTHNKQLSTSGHTAVDHRKNQHYITRPSGSTLIIVERTSLTSQCSPSTTERNQSWMNLQTDQSPSNSPTISRKTWKSSLRSPSTTERDQSWTNLQPDQSLSDSPTTSKSKSWASLVRSPSTTERNQSWTNLQPDQPLSNSSTTSRKSWASLVRSPLTTEHDQSWTNLQSDQSLSNSPTISKKTWASFVRSPSTTEHDQSWADLQPDQSSSNSPTIQKKTWASLVLPPSTTERDQSWTNLQPDQSLSNSPTIPKKTWASLVRSPSTTEHDQSWADPQPDQSPSNSPAISKKTWASLARSPSTTERNQSWTNLQPDQSPSNSPTTPKPKSWASLGRPLPTTERDQSWMNPQPDQSLSNSPAVPKKTWASLARSPSTTERDQSWTNLQPDQSPSTSPTISKKSWASLVRSPQTTERNQSWTGIQLDQSSSGSPTALANIQQTPLNLPAWRRRGCIFCRGAPTNGVTVFCKPCHDKVLRMAPIIVEVPEDHERYKSAASQFRKKWMHDAKSPKVRAIYKIVSTTTNLAKYEQYLNQVEAKRNFASRNKTRGNEKRRWHGTRRECNIGDKGVMTFCSNPSCSLCCIMKTSFDLSFFGKRTGRGKFGVGHYTSSTSSKADTYSKNDCTSSWKAVLLNKVVVGKGYKMTVGKTTLTKPPSGYDSVLGEVGDKLNYDEQVVYNDDAIRPSYLVMYDKPETVRSPRVYKPK